MLFKYGPVSIFNLEYSLRLLMVQDPNGPRPYGPKPHKSVGVKRNTVRSPS